MDKDKETIKMMLSEAYDKRDLMDDFKENVLYIDDTELENIAITHNNKLVEIFRLYENKKVSISDSELLSAIRYHLLKIKNDAIQVLNELADVLDEIVKINRLIYSNNSFIIQKTGELLTKKKKESLQKRKHELISKYHELDKKMFSFDIEKDMLDAYESEKDFYAKMESYINGYNENEERFINNCNIDLRDLGFTVRIPCKNQQNEKMLTRERISDDITELLMAKIDEYREQFKDYPSVAVAIEAHLLIMYSWATRVLQEGNFEGYEKVVNDIKKYDFEKEVEKVVGEYIELSISEPEENEVENWNAIKEELIKLGHSDIIERLENDIQEGKYEYISDYVDKELEEEPQKKKVKNDIKGI